MEISLCWYALGAACPDPTERLRTYQRALACVQAEARSKMSSAWANRYLHTDCLYEIAHSHLLLGQREPARRLLEEALPLARQADAEQPATTSNPPLEGKVAALLLQIPDDDSTEAP